MTGRILILDDEENYAIILGDLLERECYQVEAFTKPVEALVKLTKEHFDLVISDYKMPDMNGVEFLEKLRKVNQEIPMIMVSGLMNMPELIKAANSGVTLVLEKPFESQVFLDHVSRFVKPTLKNTVSEAVGNSRATSYPRNLQFLMDVSESTKTFIQSLWLRCKEGGCVFIVEPQGGEFDLIVGEVSHWKNGINGNQIQALSAKDFDLNEFKKKIESSAVDDNVVAVEGIDDLATEDQEMFYGFILGLNQNKSTDHKLTILCRLQNPVGEIINNSDLQAKVKRGTITVAALGDRPGDVAAYAMNYLPHIASEQKRPNKKTMTPDAINTLLSYSWPGNLIELMEALEKAVASGGEVLLEAADLITGIRAGQGKDFSPPQKLDLAEYLKARQDKFLADVEQRLSINLQDALTAVRVDPLPTGDFESTQDLPLLYPDLLNIGK